MLLFGTASGIDAVELAGRVSPWRGEHVPLSCSEGKRRSFPLSLSLLPPAAAATPPAAAYPLVGTSSEARVEDADMVG